MAGLIGRGTIARTGFVIGKFIRWEIALHRFMFLLVALIACSGCGPASSKKGDPDSASNVAGESTVESPSGQGGAVALDDPEAVKAVEGAAESVRRDSEGLIIDVDYRGKQVTAADLAQLNELPRLRAVRLAETGVTDEGLKALGQIASLEDLDVRDCPVSDAGLAYLSSLPKLKALRLSGKNGECSVTDDGMLHVGKIKTLKVLAIDFLWVSEEGLSSLKDLSSLQELYMAGTTIGNDAITMLAQHPSLRKLRLAGNQIDGEGIAALPKLSNLEVLDLSECLQITDGATAPIGQLSGLKDLNLWRVNISDAGIEPLQGLKSLERLNLDNTRLSDRGMGSLSGLTSLKFLHLGSTLITDEGLSHLEGLKSLENLIVTRTAVTADGVETLKQKLPNTEIQLQFIDGQ